MASATELTTAAARAQTAVGRLSEIRDSLGARDVRLTQLGPAFIRGDTRVAVAAELERVVDAAATGASLELGSEVIAVDSVAPDYPISRSSTPGPPATSSAIVEFLDAASSRPRRCSPCATSRLTKASADDQPESIRGGLPDRRHRASFARFGQRVGVDREGGDVGANALDRRRPVFRSRWSGRAPLAERARLSPLTKPRLTFAAVGDVRIPGGESRSNSRALRSSASTSSGVP